MSAPKFVVVIDTEEDWLEEHLPDPPSYSAVRAMLRLLEEKGHLKHRQDGPRYVYAPTVPRERARRSATIRRWLGRPVLKFLMLRNGWKTSGPTTTSWLRSLLNPSPASTLMQ